MRTAIVRAACLAGCLAACSSSAPVAKPAPPSAAENLPASTGPLTEAQFKALHELPGEAPAARHGQRVALADGTQAYLALPAGPGPHPGIVVIHEWWGLDAHIAHWADRLASAGWAAIAVDLYGGKVATTREDALAALKAVEPPKAHRTIAAALDFLAGDPRIAAPVTAVIGWCFGGGWALQTALAHPELDGAIIYYGQLETDPAKLAVIKARVLGVFGNLDDGIPPAAVDKFEAALAQAGVTAQLHRYDAPHAFANPSNPKYAETHAEDAWTKVLGFLDGLRTR